MRNDDYKRETLIMITIVQRTHASHAATADRFLLWWAIDASGMPG